MTPRPPGLSGAAGEFVAFIRPAPFPAFDDAARLPRGDGYAVLVLPAVFNSDGYSRDFRALLARLGYTAHGWALGLNRGPTARLIAGATAQLEAIARRDGPVSLVGHSMGGLFARLLAHRHPTLVRRVVTLTSPIHRPADSLLVPLAPFLGLWPGVDLRAIAAEIAAPPPVPSTAIYSREDGICAWMCCREPSPTADNVEVAGRHVTMLQNEAAVRIVVDRLARPPATPGRT